MSAVEFTPEEKAAADISRPYAPSRGERGTAWHQRPGLCCAQVHDDGRWPSWHPCPRKAVVHVGRLGYCGQHDPSAKLKRQEARKAAYDADAAAWQRGHAVTALGHAAIAALREILAGHNDPRGLAESVLAPFDAKYPPAPKPGQSPAHEEGFKL